MLCLPAIPQVTLRPVVQTLPFPAEFHVFERQLFFFLFRISAVAQRLVMQKGSSDTGGEQRPYEDAEARLILKQYMFIGKPQ